MRQDKTFIFDTRLIDSHLRSGLVKEAELKEYLSKLKDVADNAEYVGVEKGSEIKENETKEGTKATKTKIQA